MANSILITLKFGNDSIGDIGVHTLSDALKTNATLTILNLNNNPIGPNGAQALSEALKINSTLAKLNLMGPNGPVALSEALARALAHKTNDFHFTLTFQYKPL
ncbi:hypothetical protein BGX29_005150, partial [Mortierella sp. GBA35]